MGVLADFFIAEPDAVGQLVDGGLPRDHFVDVVDALRVDTLILDYLYASALKLPIDDCLNCEESVLVVSDEGPWVFEVPSVLVETLAATSADGRNALAAEWVKADELYGASPDDVKPLLIELCALCRTAVSQGNSVYHWLSL